MSSAINLHNQEGSAVGVKKPVVTFFQGKYHLVEMNDAKIHEAERALENSEKNITELEKYLEQRKTLYHALVNKVWELQNERNALVSQNGQLSKSGKHRIVQIDADIKGAQEVIQAEDPEREISEISAQLAEHKKTLLQKKLELEEVKLQSGYRIR